MTEAHWLTEAEQIEVLNAETRANDDPIKGSQHMYEAIEAIIANRMAIAWYTGHDAGVEDESAAYWDAVRPNPPGNPYLLPRSHWND